MRSSTSSSDTVHPWPGAAGCALAVAVLALGAVASWPLLGGAGFAPATQRAAPADDATDAPSSAPRADLVLIGDSHLRQGIVPCMLAERLGGIRVTNLARPGMPLSPEFVRAGSDALDPDSPVRCLAVAVSLATQRAPLRHRRAEFASPWNPASPLERTAARLWPAWIAPYSPQAERRRVRVSTLHPDGWRERDFVVRRAPGEGVAEERWNLLAQPFDRLMAEATRGALAALAADGVRIVVFALPSDVAEIEPLVEAWAGMTALDYARRICPADGLLVEIQFGPGDTYDGHHLHPDAARRVTRRLAEALAEAFADRKDNVGTPGTGAAE
jgi:hypothetical protein